MTLYSSVDVQNGLGTVATLGTYWYTVVFTEMHDDSVGGTNNMNIDLRLPRTHKTCLK